MTALDRVPEPCGCCEPVRSLTPLPVVNRPGLARLAYRVGTHRTFRQSMLADLVDRAALGNLSTREDDDPTVALIDAWAAVLDVLTFYQERIAEEGFLRTATEHRSVLELARTIGYEPRPGVAATTHLAFELETAEGAPAAVSVEAGTSVQSVPGPGETPQTFETVEAIEARPAWNALHPRTSERWVPVLRTPEVHLAGVATGLQPGDAVLIVGSEREAFRGSEQWDLRLAKTVEPDPDRGITKVTWEPGLGTEADGKVIHPAAKDVRCYALRRRAGLFGHNAPDWRAMPGEVQDAYRESFPSYPGNDWPGLTISDIGTDAPERTIFLDTVYPKIVPGTWLVLSSPEYRELYRADPGLEAEAVVEGSRTGFTLSAKVTRVTLEGEGLRIFDDNVRDTVVFCESEELPIAEAPVTDPVQGDTIRLASLTSALEPGRRVIVTGRRPRVRVADGVVLTATAGGASVTLRPRDELDVVEPFTEEPGTGARTWTLRTAAGTVVTATAALDELLPVPAAEDSEDVAETSSVLAVEADAADPRRSVLRLLRPLRGTYDRWSAAISANVARATQGETKRDEVLGGGDASRPFQELGLAHAPLTHVSAPTPSGTASTLEVRVNGVAWDEAPALHGLGPRDHAYVVRIDEEGGVTVRFGDGATGARIPSGTENVTATYRVGTGTAGNIAAGQLTLLMTRALGVHGVRNPLPAVGGDDPEGSQHTRENAPTTVLTFDRVVSLTDYEDFARSFAGIAKARAAWVWDGETRLVHLTVAGPGGAVVDEGSEVRENLIAAIRTSGDAHRPFLVASYEALSFDVKAGLFVASEYRWEDVGGAADAALREAFGFDRRSPAQPVTASEVVAAIHAVEGVLAVDLDALGLAGQLPVKEGVLLAHPARWEGDVLRPAQLLTVNPAGIVLESRS